jgi:hypothetical protein
MKKAVYVLVFILVAIITFLLLVGVISSKPAAIPTNSPVFKGPLGNPEGFKGPTGPQPSSLEISN